MDRILPLRSSQYCGRTLTSLVTFICKSSSIIITLFDITLYIDNQTYNIYQKKKKLREREREREKQAINPIKVCAEINHVIMRNSI
jgi:hypothetical protein